MYAKRILWFGLIVWISAFAVAPGDVMDDAGVDVTSPDTRGFPPVPWNPQDRYEVLSGISFSETNTKAIDSALAARKTGHRLMFLESQGKFKEALDTGKSGSLDRVRLLVRSDLVNDAGCRLSAEEVETLSSGEVRSLRDACLPLEADEKWDQLDQYLSVLTKYLKSPRWVAAIWREMLDVAWHRGRLDELMDAPEGILQLAFFHDLLGNTTQRDHLVMGLLDGATPVQITGFLEILPNCIPVAQASLQLWDDPDLSPEVRKEVFEWWSQRWHAGDFTTHFLKWLENGGDAKPLMDVLWVNWKGVMPVSENSKSALEGLLSRYPDSLECNFMLAWQLKASDPARAADLYEKVAGEAVRKSEHPAREDWGLFRVAPDKSSEPGSDFAYLGISGLASLNRQDRVAAVLEKQSAMAGLPAVDRARYFAAGDMDFEFANEIQSADLSLAANEPLTSWVNYQISRWTNSLEGRTVPVESVRALTDQYAALAAGTADKKNNMVMYDAEHLLHGLAKIGADARLLKSEVEKLLEVVGKRAPDLAVELDAKLRRTAAQYPELHEIFPASDVKSDRSPNDLFKSERFKLAMWLSVFAKPDLRRLGPMRGKFESGRQGHSFPPVHLLNRWSSALEGSAILLQPDPHDLKIMPLVMRQFKPGDARRLLVEIAIATGMTKCDDEELRNESKVSYDSLMAGTKLARGTEAFRYYEKARLGAGEEELNAIIEEIRLLPNVMGDTLLDELRMEQSIGKPAPGQAGSKFPGPATPPPSAAPARVATEDIRKLMGMEGSEGTLGPEEIAVLKRVLDASLDVEPEQTTNYELHAFTMLESSNGVAAWLHESNERLLKAGMSELEVCKRMLKYHPYKLRTTSSRFVKYAARLLELDPKNPHAANVLLEDAMERDDREAIEKCVFATGNNALGNLARPEILVIYGGKNAGALLKLIRRLDVEGLTKNVPLVEILHGFFLSNDPKLAAGFREWMSSWAGASVDWRMPLVNQLLTAGDVEGAADLIARSFITTATYPGYPWRFPPRVNRQREKESAWDRRQSIEAIRYHYQQDFLRAIMLRLEELGGADPEVVPTFHLIVEPTADCYDKHAVNILAKMDETARAEIVNGWRNMFARTPAASGLLLRMLEEKVMLGVSSEPERLAKVISAAAVLNGSESLIQKSWSELRPLISDTKDPATAAKAEDQAKTLVSAMLAAGNAETWKSYWAWRKTDPSALGETGSRDEVTGTRGCSTRWRAFGWPFVKERLMDVMPRMLEDQKKGTQAKLDASWVSAALATGDETLLRAVKEGLLESPAPLDELCDLGLGDVTGISPVLGVVPQENGESLVWWHLVTFPQVDQKSTRPDVPTVAFSKLDQRFDAQILAGPREDRLAIVKELPSISATGHVSLKFDETHRFILLLVSEKATGIVRWTKVMEIPDPAGASIDIPEKALIDAGFSKDDGAAPGGLPAWRSFLPAGERHDLLDIPWSGSESIMAEAWVTGSGFLTLRCMNAANEEIGSFRMSAGKTMLSVWTFQQIVTIDPEKIPPATVRLVLSVDSEGPQSFGFSGFRLAVTDSAGMPEGFRRIGRIPGKTKNLLASPDGGMLAMNREDGLITVMNARDGNFKTINMGGPAGKNDSPEATFKLIWNDSGLYAISLKGWVRKIHEGFQTCEELFHIREKLSAPAIMSMKMTADGKWLAWSVPPAQLSMISMDGRMRRDINVDGITGFETGNDGISIQTSVGGRAMLKASDYGAGEPQIIQNGTAPVQDQAAMPAIRYNKAAARGENPPLSIPASPECTVVTKDGVLYYVTGTGVVIRVRR